MEVGIPLLIPLLILLFGVGRKGYKCVCSHYFLLEHQLSFHMCVCRTWQSFSLFLCLALSWLTLDECN